jgi:alpha-glucosidase
LTRRLLALRNGSDVLRLGDLDVIHADDRLLAFQRDHEGRTLLCCFNLSPDPVSWSAPYARRPVEQVGMVDGDRLGSYAGYVAEKEA